MELLNVKDMSARLRISPRQVWKLLASGRLPEPVRLSRSVRWRKSDIDEWVRLGCVSRDEFEAACAAGVRP
jgi:predicted DNA-binding transcriptional regulator AlpA